MFCEENHSCKSQCSIFKKIKSTKIILEKIIKKNIKTMREKTVAIHNVLKKKTTKLNS
jgi:hypothetical protein